MPLFHIDFHGKYPRKDPEVWGDIDVGTKSMINYFEKSDEKSFRIPMT